MEYKVAEVSEIEFEAIKKEEKLMKDETGKDFIMVAWERNKQKLFKQKVLIKDKKFINTFFKGTITKRIQLIGQVIQ